MIRQATFNDIEGIIAIGNETLSKSHLKPMEINVIKTKRNLAMMIANKKFAGFVDDVEGVIKGFIFGTVESMFWTDTKYVSDVVFVSNSANGIFLKNELEKWGKANGASVCMLAQSSGIEVDRTNKFYETDGYQLVGGVHMKEI